MAILGIDALMKELGGQDHIYGGDTNSTITILGGSLGAEKFYEDFKSSTLKHVNEILSYADKNKGLEHSLMECMESAGLTEVLKDKVGYLKRCMYLHYITKEGQYDYSSLYVREASKDVALSLFPNEDIPLTSEDEELIDKVTNSLYHEISERMDDNDITWTIPLQQIDSVVCNMCENNDFIPTIICRTENDKYPYAMVDMNLVKENGDSDSIVQLYVEKILTSFLFVLSWISESPSRRIKSMRENINVVREAILAGGIGVYIGESDFTDDFRDDLYKLINKMIESSDEHILGVFRTFKDGFESSKENFSLLGYVSGRSYVYKMVRASVNIAISSSGDVIPFISNDLHKSIFDFKDEHDICFNLLSALIPNGDYGYTIDIHPNGCKPYVLSNVVSSNLLRKVTKFNGAGDSDQFRPKLIPDDIRERGMMLLSASIAYING